MAATVAAGEVVEARTLGDRRLDRLLRDCERRPREVKVTGSTVSGPHALRVGRGRERLDIECVDLIAHSWGTTAAGLYATQNPHRLRRLGQEVQHLVHDDGNSRAVGEAQVTRRSPLVKNEVVRPAVRPPNWM